MKVLVLGAAVSGKAAARLARRLGHEVEVFDRDSVTQLPLREEGFTVHSGAWTDRLLRTVELVVASPGIPQHADPIVDTLSLGIPLWSEIEFASRLLDVPYAAVTGTNGKTTVATAAAEMLIRTGAKAAAVGNVGTPLSDVVGEQWDALVIEASSFQLRFIEAFHPVAAAILNIAPDHLDWHGTFEAYAAAKCRIYENQVPGDILVFDADDAVAVAAAAAAPGRVVAVSGRVAPDGGNGPRSGALVIDDVEFPLPNLDSVYLMDLTAAATIARHLGAGDDGIESVLTGFVPGVHRRTLVGSWHGVDWVDDSKATNPHAAVAAASAYPSVLLIAGGRNKGLDLGSLIEVPSVRRIFAIGEASAELFAMDPERVEASGALEVAVRAAGAIAQSGDTVLLAPGCASFDQFDSYAHRGAEFARLAVELNRDEEV